MSALVVLHAPGDDGLRWREAASGWSDEVLAPDLVVTGASGDRTDVVWLLLEQMEARREQRPLVIGCGEHSLAAETFALAHWVGGLVLVDGLGGAWTDAAQQVAAQDTWLRSKADDPDLVGYPQLWDERFMGVLRANVTCPVLLIETPASITPAGEAERRQRQFAGPAELVRLPAAEPLLVLDAVRAWSA